MKKYLLKILLLVIPLLLYVLTIIIIDPFNYFAISDFYSYSVRKNVSLVINPVMFNLIEFKRNPVPDITISDSRFAQKNLSLLESRTNKKFSEIFIFDGMIKDLISGFWFANSQTRLKNVYIAVSFNNFYISQRNDLVKSVDVVLNDPLLYFFNLNVINASIKCLSGNYDNIIPDSSLKSNFDKNSFWNEILVKTKNRFYVNYRFPYEYLQELEEIAKHCKENEINLYFIVPPTNVDMQNLVSENGLEDTRKMFLTELSKIAKTYNLDFMNSITSNRDIYIDPNHLNKDTLTYLFSRIVNNQSDSIANFVK